MVGRSRGSTTQLGDGADHLIATAWRAAVAHETEQRQALVGGLDEGSSVAHGLGRKAAVSAHATSTQPPRSSPHDKQHPLSRVSAASPPSLFTSSRAASGCSAESALSVATNLFLPPSSPSPSLVLLVIDLTSRHQLQAAASSPQ